MDDYQFDAFEDGSSKQVGEQQLQKLRGFVEDYAKQLRDFEEALDESLSEVWDTQVDPVSLFIKPYEQTDILHLAKTDNKIFTKVVSVFGTLCNQIRLLKETAETKFYPPLIMYGEILGDGAGEGDTQIQIGKMLPFMMELSTLVNRAYTISKNLVSQLASLYSPANNIYTTSFRNVHLQTVFEHLACLFSVLITLDQIIANNAYLVNAFNKYIRMTKSIKADPNKYAVQEDSLWQTEKLLFSLKGQLLDGLIFQNCVEQEFDFPGLVDVKANKNFKAEFFLNVRGLYQLFAPVKNVDSAENEHKDKFPGISGLYIFYMILFKDPSDKAFFKTFFETHKRFPVINLYANVMWFTADFIKSKLPAMMKLIGNVDVIAARKDSLKIMDKEFSAKVKYYYLQVSKWMVRMESNLTNRAELWDILATRNSLFTQGVLLSVHIGNLFKTMVGLHLDLGTPMTSAHVRSLCQCCELLKAIASTFHRRSAVIGETLTLMMRQTSAAIAKGIAPVRVRLETAKTYNDTQLDVLAASRLALSMLSGPATPERRILLRLAMHVIFQMNFLRDSDIDEIRVQLKRLDLICDLQDSIRDACDCAFLFWSKEMLAPYFGYLFQHPVHAQRLHYIFAAIKDIVPMFHKAVHVDPAVLIDAYKKDIEDAFNSHIIKPLCRDIETDLRLHIHSHLEVSERDPLKTGIKDLARFVNIKPLRFFDKYIDIKAHVSHYLDTTFYNLNTVALYDWKTYGEMRNLAEYKYGLALTEVHLPGQTLEQGLDVLEIMRNIHIFVAKYNYNINNQIFIEKQSDSKTLNTINIGHISNSIRTHGTGIMNTTVNFTFQFLRQKFNIFSQFLFDDHIKSRLYKDIKFFKENKEQLNNMYAFERAKKFNKDIRKLGVNDQGLSFFDQFRLLITQIGNAMGYIRLVRSGGLYYVANAIKFVPDIEDISKFEDLVSKDNLAPPSGVAAKNLDATVDSLSKHFAEGTEYFKMLVSVFSGEFRNPNNQHLRNFYVIVPPLTLNFIEHILIAKDKLFKKTKNLGNDTMMFTDDGFAIGIAYILKLLDQNKDFDSLHWFDAVAKRFEDEQKEVLANSKQLKKEDQQTTQLTLKKLKRQLMEFELLKYSFYGARIFFKD